MADALHQPDPRHDFNSIRRKAFQQRLAGAEHRCLRRDSSPVAAGAPAPDPNAPKLTVAVVVIDSLMPQEIGTALTPTPTLNKFRDEGTAYADSRSVFFAETIPNHVAMMTGVYPGRSGIPANTYWNREGTPGDADLSLPYELEPTPCSPASSRTARICATIRKLAQKKKKKKKKKIKMSQIMDPLATRCLLHFVKRLVEGFRDLAHFVHWIFLCLFAVDSYTI